MVNETINGENIHLSIMTVANIIFLVVVIVANFFYLKNETNKIKIAVDNVRDEKDADKDTIISEINKLQSNLLEKIETEVSKIVDKFELKINRANELIEALENRIEHEIKIIDKKLDEQKNDDIKIKQQYDELKEHLTTVRTTIKNIETSIENDKKHFNTILKDKLNLVEEKYSIHINNINKTIETLSNHLKENIKLISGRLDRLEKALDKIYTSKT